jgi:hypothetical protein
LTQTKTQEHNMTDEELKQAIEGLNDADRKQYNPCLDIDFGIDSLQNNRRNKMTTEQLAKDLLAIIDSEMYVNDFGGLQAGRDATTDIHAAMGKLQASLAQPYSALLNRERAAHEQERVFQQTQSSTWGVATAHEAEVQRINSELKRLKIVFKTTGETR